MLGVNYPRWCIQMMLVTDFDDVCCSVIKCLMTSLRYWWPIWDPSDRFQSIEKNINIMKIGVDIMILSSISWIGHNLRLINITLSVTICHQHTCHPFKCFIKNVIKWKVNVLYISSSSELVCLASFETISWSNAFHWISSTGIEIVFRSFRFSLSLSSRFRRSGSTWP